MRASNHAVSRSKDYFRNLIRLSLQT